MAFVVSSPKRAIACPKLPLDYLRGHYPVGYVIHDQNNRVVLSYSGRPFTATLEDAEAFAFHQAS